MTEHRALIDYDPGSRSASIYLRPHDKEGNRLEVGERTLSSANPQFETLPFYADRTNEGKIVQLTIWDANKKIPWHYLGEDTPTEHTIPLHLDEEQGLAKICLAETSGTTITEEEGIRVKEDASGVITDIEINDYKSVLLNYFSR